MRNYQNIDRYLTELSRDIYPQPQDSGHTDMIEDVFERWIRELPIARVLDVGCGATQVAKQFFDKIKVDYWGISLGDDAAGAIKMDMSFLSFPDSVFDLVWCRHTLEHSPMPLLTLMELHRVSRNFLCLIVPNPDYFTYAGRNHYAVSDERHTVWLLRRAGWRPLRVQLGHEEYRFLCKKEPRIGYEGYAPSPLPHNIYAFERDLLVNDQDVDVEQWMNEQN